MADCNAVAWFDERSESPLLAEHARTRSSFLKAVADGKVDFSELEEQQKRVVALMREVEPLLSEEARERVTELLHEVTVYDMMTTLYLAAQSGRTLRNRQ
ncbi:MAG: hypothetical protein ISQ07_00875 [Pirellulales bacterium]|jgi:hypothetical protein|nr:hypothetical protein [Pirellulales bacterium]